MKLRTAGPDDAPAVAALEAAVFGIDAWSPAAVREELTGESRWAVVAAEHDGPVVGYAVLQVISETAEVHRVAVAPSFRRKRVGTALLEALLSADWAQGCSEVLLELRADNVAGRRLYERFGFVQLAHRPGYYADRTDALVLKVSGPLQKACEG